MTVISDEDAKRNLAANLERLMKNRDLNQTDLARLTDQPTNTISRACRGLNVPRGTVLARLAEALDISIDRLLGPPPEFSEKSG